MFFFICLCVFFVRFICFLNVFLCALCVFCVYFLCVFECFLCVFPLETCTASASASIYAHPSCELRARNQHGTSVARGAGSNKARHHPSRELRVRNPHEEEPAGELWSIR